MGVRRGHASDRNHRESAHARRAGCGSGTLRTARRVFIDRGEEGHAIVCKASGFDRSTFASMVLLRRKTERAGHPTATGAVEKILSLYDAVTARNAKRVLRFWNLRQRDLGGPRGPRTGTKRWLRLREWPESRAIRQPRGAPAAGRRP